MNPVSSDTKKTRGYGGSLSDRKATAIYRAVHDELMSLRILLQRGLPSTTDQLDYLVAQAMDRATDAAVAAYRTPLEKESPRG